MINKQEYNKGIRCKGMCTTCNETIICYQAIQSKKQEKKVKKVFLGGTCAETVWREKLIKMLEIDYFNPVVEDWTEECMKEERIQRETCDYCLYVITPSMQGVYSIAEVVDDSNKRPEKTIFCLLQHEIPSKYEIGSDGKTPFEIYPNNKREFNVSETKSLNQVGEMVKRNGGVYVDSLEKVAYYLNSQK